MFAYGASIIMENPTADQQSGFRDVSKAEDVLIVIGPVLFPYHNMITEAI